MENNGSEGWARGRMEVTELMRNPFLVLRVRSKPEPPLNSVVMKFC